METVEREREKQWSPRVRGKAGKMGRAEELGGNKTNWYDNGEHTSFCTTSIVQHQTNAQHQG